MTKMERVSFLNSGFLLSSDCQNLSGLVVFVEICTFTFIFMSNWEQEVCQKASRNQDAIAVISMTVEYLDGF